MEVTEVVIYTLKEEYREQTKQVLTELRNLVQEMDGLKSIKSFHSCNEAHKLMDHVTWASEEDAKKAVDAFKTLPQYGEIVSKFEETIHFDQYNFFM